MINNLKINLNLLYLLINILFVQKIYTNTIIDRPNIITTNSTKIICGLEKCNLTNQNCNEVIKHCECKSHLTTFPIDNIEKCNYIRKSKLTAFLLEAFITWGAGHFYLHNFDYAIPKVLFWAILYIFVILFKAISVDDEEKNKSNPIRIMLLVFGSVFLCGMILWYIVDLILIGSDYFKDGNLVDLLAW